MRRQVINHGFLKVRFPEIVNPQTAFWVARIPSVLYMLIHLITTPLPNGLIGVAAAIGVINASLDHLVSSASSAVRIGASADRLRAK
jgi:hypothetical protein